MKSIKKQNYTLNPPEIYETIIQLRKENKRFGFKKIDKYLLEHNLTCSKGAINGWIYYGKKPFVTNILNQISKDSVKLTEEKAYILGTLCGDGFISTGYRIGLCVCDKEFAEYFKYCLEKVYGINCSIIPRMRKQSNFCSNPKKRYDVTLVSKLAFQDIQQYDNSFKTKTWLIPAQIINSPKEIQAKFLQAFADSEANVRFRKGRSEMVLCSGNIAGLRMIKEMLFSSFGIESNEGDNGSGVAIIRISKYDSLKKFYDNINFIINRKKETLKKAVESYNRKEIRVYSEDFKNLAKELFNQNLNYIQVAKLLNTSPANTYGWEKKWKEEAEIVSKTSEQNTLNQFVGINKKVKIEIG